MIIICLVH